MTSRKSWGDQPERAPPCLAAPSLPTAAQNELHPSISFQTAKSLLLPASKFLLAPSPRPTTTSPRLLGSRLERAGLPFLSPGPGPASPRLARSLGGVSCSWLRYLVALGRRMDVCCMERERGRSPWKALPVSWPCRRRWLGFSFWWTVDVTMAQTAYSSRRLTDRIRGHALPATPTTSPPRTHARGSSVAFTPVPVGESVSANC